LIKLLKLPEIRKIDNIDDTSTTLLHAKIIQSKSFLKKLYIDFYNQFKSALSEDIKDKIFVELGSGGGFIKEVIPNVITSDVMVLPNVDKHFSALNMPFENNTVDAFFMIDVFHHINDASSFLKELNRCLKIGGKVVMIEPANTLWGRFIWKNFHHEPFELSGNWSFNETGPLSSANGALPWIVFLRDRERLEREFSSLKMESIRIHTPLRYLISGGVSIRQLLPSSFYDIVKGLEKVLEPFNEYLAMFMTVSLKKIESAS